VSKLPEGMERPIYLNVHAEKKLLLIQTENPFTGEVTFQDGLPKTSSGDEFNHGFGMKSIRLIAEKYHGSVSSRAKDGTFYVNVVIPL
jgi:sensor histidine kinase YesM